jgi:hypothetical protein
MKYLSTFSAFRQTSATNKEVFDRARKRYPGRELFIMKVPDNVNMLL